MPAYNEEESIAGVVGDFQTLNIIDEILVVDNNCSDLTAQLAKKAGASVIVETRQGFGYACQRGLRQAKGEYVILVEPDGTFVAKDIFKFLAYIEDFGLVQGTRTTKEMIWHGANMGHMLKWGNWFVAKILQFLYRGPSLSDMGCTYRMIKGKDLGLIKNSFNIGGSAFLAEMTIEALKKNIKTIEIPVNYLSRKGVSKITGSKPQTLLVCLQMFLIIAARIFKK